MNLPNLLIFCYEFHSVWKCFLLPLLITGSLPLPLKSLICPSFRIKNRNVEWKTAFLFAFIRRLMAAESISLAIPGLYYVVDLYDILIPMEYVKSS